ncbi:MAG: hypothetical protein JNJ54_20465 [Myxococcaceae bacterium]|nr:hypothetical protein [Myxococcaceae bacterium]
MRLGSLREKVGALFVAVALASCTPPEVRACNDAASMTPIEHFKACAPLFKAEPCRRYLLDLDGGLPHPSEHARACAPEYCPRMSAPVRACLGEQGTPAAGFRVEFEFYSAVFEVDYGRAAKSAEVAWFKAASRLYDEAKAASRARDEEHEARTKLVFELRGDWQSVTIESMRPKGGPKVELLPTALDPEQCRSFVSASLDGGELPQGSVARLTSEKKVQFKVVRCVMEALLDAGVTPDNLLFATMPARDAQSHQR